MLLQLNNVETYYGSIAALKGISINVKQGEIVALIGANGAGKSTLLSTICGQPKPRSGEILLSGEDIAGLDSHEVSQRRIAIAPEGRRIFHRMSVNENLIMGGWLVGKNRQNTNMEKVFELFPRLKERRNQQGGTLSGGEQQMLAIGRALMSEPQVLLLDEPSLGLAPKFSRLILSTLKRINQDEGMTILLAEQDAYHALKIAHRGYVLVTGAISLSGISSELLSNPAVRAAYLEGGA